MNKLITAKRILERPWNNLHHWLSKFDRSEFKANFLFILLTFLWLGFRSRNY